MLTQCWSNLASTGSPSCHSEHISTNWQQENSPNFPTQLLFFFGFHYASRETAACPICHVVRAPECNIRSHKSSLLAGRQGGSLIYWLLGSQTSRQAKMNVVLRHLCAHVG